MNTWTFLYRTYRYVLPEVHQQLNYWHENALAIPDSELRQQALASIRDKTFHCEGGCVYAAADFAARHILIPLVVAFQTISDYLDNLCDRSSSFDPEDFRSLHESMLDAVSLTRPVHDYYRVRRLNGEPSEDGGYLEKLVRTCREHVKMLPGYPIVEEQVLIWVGLYCDLQVHKHVSPDEREALLLNWWKQHEVKYPELFWNEFAAATGSTLGVFSLFLAACQPSCSEQQVKQTAGAYFPWISAIHILLDYLIDLEEDAIGGDLNFISYYSDPQEIVSRLKWIANRARREAEQLVPLSPVHLMAVDGLLGFYLSDGKVKRQPLVSKVSKTLLQPSPWRIWLFYLYSKWYRGDKVQIQAPPNR
ncbi:tetraprenyl-beta-curcumene synthase family protein [Effusibacillus consociatus]|uniref:Tetraprenyl-beta-curcumene synthase family protein n=1 Tax=Effusibacillus consociatus TaxID=1117041 RepID=A0ABV9Q531_9BACL